MRVLIEMPFPAHEVPKPLADRRDERPAGTASDAVVVEESDRRRPLLDVADAVLLSEILKASGLRSEITCQFQGISTRTFSTCCDFRQGEMLPI